LVDATAGAPKKDLDFVSDAAEEIGEANTDGLELDELEIQVATLKSNVAEVGIGVDFEIVASADVDVEMGVSAGGNVEVWMLAATNDEVGLSVGSNVEEWVSAGVDFEGGVSAGVDFEEGMIFDVEVGVSEGVNNKVRGVVGESAALGMSAGVTGVEASSGAVWASAGALRSSAAKVYASAGSVMISGAEDITALVEPAIVGVEAPNKFNEANLDGGGQKMEEPEGEVTWAEEPVRASKLLEVPGLDSFVDLSEEEVSGVDSFVDSSEEEAGFVVAAEAALTLAADVIAASDKSEASDDAAGVFVSESL